MRAAETGHNATVELLLKRPDVNVNRSSAYLTTLLHAAAAEGHEAVARLLPTRAELDINSKDWDDETLLHKAATRGYEGVVRLYSFGTKLTSIAMTKTGRGVRQWRHH
jgi:ankyrin repeat protein